MASPPQGCALTSSHSPGTWLWLLYGLSGGSVPAAAATVATTTSGGQDRVDPADGRETAHGRPAGRVARAAAVSHEPAGVCEACPAEGCVQALGAMQCKARTGLGGLVLAQGAQAGHQVLHEGQQRLQQLQRLVRLQAHRRGAPAPQHKQWIHRRRNPSNLRQCRAGWRGPRREHRLWKQPRGPPTRYSRGAHHVHELVGHVVLRGGNGRHGGGSGGEPRRDGGGVGASGQLALQLLRRRRRRGEDAAARRGQRRLR